MESRSIKADTPMSAKVVRQFVPSRIERQLLAQVFECIVNTRGESQPVACDSDPNSAPHEQRRAA